MKSTVMWDYGLSGIGNTYDNTDMNGDVIIIVKLLPLKGFYFTVFQNESELHLLLYSKFHVFL